MKRSKQLSLKKRVWNKSRGICCLCGLPMIEEPDTPVSFTIEHLQPKCRKGSLDLENLDGSHRFCNIKKGERLLSEIPEGWRREMRKTIKYMLEQVQA